ncbi:Protein serine phosphatase with GAF(S) sensor(S) [Microbacterium sp. C448]|uniref:ATP-binding SpoIIE family protein phosphatase n=1 Tax=Microbacterium TaxID=33882 RepID=UPI0003DDFD33|nr:MULTISPECIES: SpoIIE family protein phosphatase [Microbacterium]CDK00168.1 Protein serine phosphatase with GAF(S) sensor(S) [Microbacterium sp. C448]
MTDTLETAAQTPADPPAGVAHDAPSGAARRRRRAEKRTAAKAARRPELGPAPSRARRIDIEIDPGDPLLVYLQSASGPVEIGALPAYSSAVAKMIAQEVQLVVPLVTSGELVGILALGQRLSERTYSRNDRRLLDSLARYAAPALRLGQLMRVQERQARERERIEQELHVAQLIQQQFLPAELPELGGWTVAAFYRPARTVGGDFYDLIELPDGRIMVVTGDVTDKGVPAALVMASTHALLRSTAAVVTSPGEVLRRVNELLIPQIPTHMFVTCLVLVLDLESGRTHFANAGHNLPYVRRGDDVVQLHARGMPLGLMSGSIYEEHETVIGRGEIVLLYSDGITEQHDSAGEMFGFGRTADLVAGAGTGQELVDGAVQELGIFSTGVEQEDDITLVTLQRGRRGGAAETVSFAVASVPGNERDAMDRVASIAAHALGGARLNALKTAVSETVMNAIEHGNRGDATLDVLIAVRRTSDYVTVEVADFGRGLRRDAETPDLDLKLAGLQTPRGWGLFLVRELVDKVEEFSDGDRHVVRLAMRADGRDAAGGVQRNGGNHEPES